MKRRTFLKSLAASVAGLFCASAAAKKQEPEKFVGWIACDHTAEYRDGRYWVCTGLSTEPKLDGTYVVTAHYRTLGDARHPEVSKGQ